MAITNVYYRPKIWSPAYNPIVWSFISNKNQEIDFSYVIDVYVNAATGATAPTYRLKQRPNPIGVGMVDVSSIMQPFINLTGYSAEEGWSLDYRDSDYIVGSVFLKVGEEYVGASAGSIMTTFNGLGATGEPAYTMYAQDFSRPVRVIPAALPYEDGIQNMSATGPFGTFAPYIMRPASAGGLGKFLKRDSNSITVTDIDHHTLAFLNWYDNAATSAQSVVQLVSAAIYNSAGTLLDTLFLYNNTGAGGGPQSTNLYISAIDNIKYNMLTVACGPKDLAVVEDYPTAAYYDVQAYVKASATGTSNLGVVASETVRFTIDTECQNLYPVVRLSWLNDLGGRDYYNFDMFYEKTSTSTGQVYSEAPIDWSSTTPVAIDGSADTTGNWLYGGNKSFNRVVSRKFSIQSNWLLQDAIDFLGAVSESPSVWAYIGDNPIPYTVTVDNADYTYKNVKQTKLIQASFNCTITKTQQKQNL
jgi:hypothetical protein